MKRSSLNRSISALRAMLAHKRNAIPASIYGACAAALILAARSARTGDASRAVLAIEQARAFLDSFAC